MNKLRNITAKILIVQTEWQEKEDPIIETAKQTMLLEKQETVCRWFGTFAPESPAVQYTFRSSKAFFGYLSGFSSFSAEEEIGFDDIAFVDQKENVLFYTTTHEGYTYLNAQITENDLTD